MIFRAVASSSAANFYVVEDPRGRRLAIEAGLRLELARRAVGWQLAQTCGVLVSHHHGDHAGQIGAFLRAGVGPVYASATCWRELGRDPGQRMPDEIAVHPGVVFNIPSTGGPAWRVLPFDLRHDAPGALGFLVADRFGGRLLYACDTGYLPYRFRGVTHLAVECNYSEALLALSEAPLEQKRRALRHHLSLERLLRSLAAGEWSELREVHLLHLSDRHSDAEAFAHAIRRATGVPVRIAPRLAAELREAEAVK